MNIKGLGITHLTARETSSRTEAKEKTRTAESGDRDANGRRDTGSGSDDHPPTEEQIQKAIEYLASHAGVKENNLQVKRHNFEGRVSITIEDHLGKVVRRIPPNQIRTLAQMAGTDSTKGQIYHRAM